MERPPQLTPRRQIPPPTPRPVIPAALSADARVDWILPILIAVGFIGALALPIASALILKSANQVAALYRTPIDLGSRTHAFFLAVFGGWGLVLYIWSCCVYSQSKGKAWTWGLLGLPALLSFLGLALTGNPALGLLCLLGLGGFFVPLILKPDRVLLSAAGSVSKTDVMLRMARKTTWIWAFALFVGASIAYGNSFRGGMTLDNKYIIEEYFNAVSRMNPRPDLFSWTTMLPLFFQNDYWWPKGISGLYRPVAAMSYWLNYTANHSMGNAPLDPFQYHVVNFFLHWIAAYLGFILVRQLTGRTSVAFFASLLFVTHPIATESVSNIIGRSDILAAIAVFSCLALYIRSTRAGPWKIAPWLALFIVSEAIVGLILAGCAESSPPHWLPYVGAMTAVAVPVAGFFAIKAAWKFKLTQAPWLGAMMGVLAVGLFSKESAIAVVGLIVLYDVIYRWTLENLRGAVPSLVAFSILGAIGAAVALKIGQFGALGLSEGLKPILVIILLGFLGVAGGLALAWTFWVRRRPLTSEQILDPWTKYFVSYTTVIPPILLWLVARRWVFANASPPETPFLDNPIRGLGFFSARMTASDVFVRLIALLAWPARLSADYSFNQIPLFNGHLGSAETWLALVGCMTIAGLLVLIGLTFRRNKPICFLLTFFLIAYLPTSNFLIIIGSIMAERFLYLPLIAFVACVVLGVDELYKRVMTSRANVSAKPIVRSTPVYGLLVALALGYGIRARFRNDDWLSDITLWTAAAKASPNSFRSYQSKAYALYERYQSRGAGGLYDSNPALRAQDIDECYQTAALAKPIVDPLPPEQNSSRLYLHLGMYYSVKGMTVAHFAPDGTISPGDEGEAWFRLAEKVLQEGVVIDRTFNVGNHKKEIARKILKESDIPDVGLPPVYSCLGAAYARLGEWPKSAQTFRYACHLEPIDSSAYFGMATAYSNEGRQEAEAIALLQALIIDGSQKQLWSPLAGILTTLDHTNTPGLTVSPDGKLQLHTEIPEVRSVLCSAYQGLVRTCILARRKAIADQFRSAAINQWKFSSDLFDDLVSDLNAESPVPPPPD